MDQIKQNISFSRTIGQQRAKELLENALQKEQLSHTLLIQGNKGIGQTALCLDLADHFNQFKIDSFFPCFPHENKYKEKELIKQNNLLFNKIKENPYEWNATNKVYISITQIRLLEKQLIYKNEHDKIRVVVLFNFEKVAEAANHALLKILEEPPPNTYFILSSENPKTTLMTIKSRCQQLNLLPLTEMEIMEFAKNNDYQINEKHLPWCRGSINHVIELQNYSNDPIADIFNLFDKISQKNWFDLYEWMENSSILANKDSVLFCFSLALEILRKKSFERALKYYQEEISKISTEWDKKNITTDQVYFFLQETINRVLANANPVIACKGAYLEFKQKQSITK